LRFLDLLLRIAILSNQEMGLWQGFDEIIPRLKFRTMIEINRQLSHLLMSLLIVAKFSFMPTSGNIGQGDLTRIDGIDVTTAFTVLAEVGADMSRF
jgi:hypothetical protein